MSGVKNDWQLLIGRKISLRKDACRRKKLRPISEDTRRTHAMLRGRRRRVKKILNRRYCRGGEVHQRARVQRVQYDKTSCSAGDLIT